MFYNINVTFLNTYATFKMLKATYNCKYVTQ